VKKTFFFWVVFLWCSVFVHANELRPDGLIFSDYPGSTVLVIDKSACRLMVYKFQESWKMHRVFPCTTGKVNGDKFREGDLKTPIGIYWLNQAWAGWELAQYYGNILIGLCALVVPLVVAMGALVALARSSSSS